MQARHTGKTGSPAEEVLFSLDYGRCWQSVPLANAMLVDNIRCMLACVDVEVCMCVCSAV